MDIHGAGSDIAGWKIEGDGRYFRNVYGTGSGVGMWFAGNGNTMHNGKAEGNSGHGLLIVGDGNLVDTADSFANGGDGVNVVGHSNTIDGMSIGDRGKGNGGDGLHVVGSANHLAENDAFANGGDGFDVSGGTVGSPNVLLKNTAGDRGKGNLGNGFLLGAGDGGNGLPNPVELKENEAKSNALYGFLLYGAGHELEKNESGGSGDEQNGSCEFDVASGNFNNAGNKYNGVTIPGSSGSPFPTGCFG
jgi:hypothetical protein